MSKELSLSSFALSQKRTQARHRLSQKRLTPGTQSILASKDPKMMATEEEPVAEPVVEDHQQGGEEIVETEASVFIPADEQKQEQAKPRRAPATTLEVQVDPAQLVQVAEIYSVTIAALGKVGTGKSALLACLIGQMLTAVAGWRDGNEICFNDYFLEDCKLKVTLCNTKGCRGSWKEDWPILQDLVAQLAQKNADVSCVFLVFTSIRFTPAEQNIIDMIKAFTTSEFQDLIQVVITHAPPSVQTPLFLEDVVEHLSFLGNDAESILKRVHFVDLIHPEVFAEGTAAREEIRVKWIAAQTMIRGVVNASRNKVHVKNIRKLYWVQELMMVYSTEIYIAVSLLVIVILIGVFISYHSLTQDQIKAIHQCMKEKSILQEQAAAQANGAIPAADFKVTSVGWWKDVLIATVAAAARGGVSLLGGN